MDFRATIARLSEPPGVSGYEQRVAECAAELLAPCCDTVKTLPLFAVAGTRYASRPDAPRVLLDAHIDQIGFIVTGHAGHGFLRFAACGGFDPRVLPAKEVLIHAKSGVLRGIVACLPPHLRDAETDPSSASPIEDLVIDSGFDDAEALIPIGTPITVDAPPFTMGEDYIGAAALDDRACFTSLLYCMQLLADEPLPVQVTVVGSSREETGADGATTATYDVRPEYAVAVDVTHGATPDAPRSRTFPMGSGAAIGIGPHLNRKVSSTLVHLAQEQKIPYTREILCSRTGTNATAMQIVRAGVATGLVSLPLRYMHTACEVIREADARACGELLAAFIRSFREGVPKCWN